ncbi:MAG: hypothetical protein J2P36_03775 [Ktedonobacteraceae bacterium]|nr:hypothetical protein [Ktedonobacteraceae bacterium]
MSNSMDNPGANSSTGANPTGGTRPVALVYRGPGGCKGCSEAVAALLRSSKWNFDVKYVGPKENLKLSAATLRTAVLYAQPGGNGDTGKAYRNIRRQLGGSDVMSSWVKSGGRYLGICMGGFIAGDTPNWPGFDLLPGTVGQWINSPGASWKNDNDTVIPVKWRGNARWMYFQDGPYFKPDPEATGVQVLATYMNGKVAAMTAPYVRGKMAVSGPHPEADESWYSEHHLTNPDGVNADLGHDLIDTLMQ